MEMESYGGGAGYDMYGGAAGPGMPGGGQPGAGNPLVAAVAGGVQAQVADRVLTAVRAASSTQTADKTPSLRERANQAFVGGDEALALRYLYAHMVSEYEQANSSLSSVTFSPVLREPVWWLRWGVSLHVRGDDLEAPHPIVVGMKSPLPDRNATAGRGRYGARGRAPGPEGGAVPMAAPGMEGMEMEGMGMGGPRPNRAAAGAGGVSVQIDETLHKNLGLVSEQVGAELNARFQNGSFGRGFQGVEVAPAVAPAAPGMRVDQRTGELVQESPMPGGAGYEIGAEGMPAAMPMPGPGAAPGALPGSESMQEPAMMDTMATEALQGQGVMQQPGQAPQAAPSFTPDLPRWRPGLAFLGEVPLSESLEKAKENDLQFVLHFDVIVQGSKTRTIMRVVNVADEKTVVASKQLDNVECYKLVQAEKTTEPEYVSEIIMPMFEVLDEKLKVVEMPQLNAEQARGRVASLLETAPPFDWSSMAEVRLFQSQGLLNEQEVAAAMHLFGGDNALVLLYGMPAERREIVSREFEK